LRIRLTAFGYPNLHSSVESFVVQTGIPSSGGVEIESINWKNLLNSELQFFMNAEDEAKFVAFAEPFVESMDRESDNQWFLCVGGYRIQFLRSQLYQDVLIGGRIALRTKSDDPNSRPIETLFNKFRRWIKKSYFNRMTVRNINIPQSTMKWRNHWIGPSLLSNLRNNGKPTLAGNRDAIVVFEFDAD